MALVAMRQLLDHAAEHGYGVPAFNVNNLEQVQAIMEAAAETRSPVILQASAGARKYAGETFLAHLVTAATSQVSSVGFAGDSIHTTSTPSVRARSTAEVSDRSMRTRRARPLATHVSSSPEVPL